ncbi:MAG: carbohydrate ABC transporter permease, partial [Gemmatimonadaceae bacterium]
MSASTVPAVRRRRRAGPAALTALTWVIGLLFFSPVLWLVITAFKKEVDASTDTPRIFFTPTLEQFRNVFSGGFWPYVGNSAFATVVSTIIVLLLAIPAAYALSVRPVPKTQDVLFFFISTKMLPVVAVILPLYIITQRIGLLDNVWAIVILYTSMNLPIAVWMLRSFMAEVPGEVLEAAEVDGAGLVASFREVLLPMI